MTTIDFRIRKKPYVSITTEKQTTITYDCEEQNPFAMLVNKPIDERNIDLLESGKIVSIPHYYNLPAGAVVIVVPEFGFTIELFNEIIHDMIVKHEL